MVWTRFEDESELLRSITICQLSSILSQKSFKLTSIFYFTFEHGALCSCLDEHQSTHLWHNIRQLGISTWGPEIIMLLIYLWCDCDFNDAHWSCWQHSTPHIPTTPTCSYWVNFLFHQLPNKSWGKLHLNVC